LKQPTTKVHKSKFVNSSVTIKKNKAYAASSSGVGKINLGGPVSKRPTFNSDSKKLARFIHNFQTNAKKVGPKDDLTKINAAMPHRMSWKDIRDNVEKVKTGADKPQDFSRWTQRFLDAGSEKIQQMPVGSDIRKLAQSSQDSFKSTRDEFLANPGHLGRRTAFEKSANQFHANVPDLGPHLGVNNVVGERAHLNVIDNGPGKKRSLSPMSRRVRDMSPGRLSGVAVDSKGDLIDVRGRTHRFSDLETSDAKRIQSHGVHPIPSFNKHAPGPFL